MEVAPATVLPSILDAVGQLPVTRLSGVGRDLPCAPWDTCDFLAGRQARRERRSAADT